MCACGSLAAGHVRACGVPMAEGKVKRACSGKCRAGLSRRRRDDVRAARIREIRALLEAALRKLGDRG